MNIFKKSAILIDGANFYFKAKKDLGLNSLDKFNFSEFAKFISVETDLAIKTFYIGKIRTDGTSKVQALFNEQRKLLAHLKNSGFTYALGYLLKDKGGKIHEKGVDVKIAIDLLMMCYEKKVSNIFLVSSDTDLIPAVRIAKKLGVEVTYIGFSHMPSLALIKESSSSRLLIKKDLEAFFD